MNFVTSGLSIGAPSKFYLGRDFFTTLSTEHWQGRVDELRIWDHAKSQTAIQNGMNCALRGTESGLVAYYPFDQGSPVQNNAGVTTSWSVPTSSPYSYPYFQLQNFSMTGNNSNWICSSVTLNGFCSPAVGEEVDDRSGEQEQVVEDVQQEFKVYPNPGSGWFNLKLNASNESTLQWKVLNLTGVVMMEGILPEGETDIQVQTEALAKGMYLIQLFKEEKNLGTKKWIKNN
ncbi:MAG: T9SS type A sorting domain-containing protein [Saprospiraceae bacterium]|nr:T9SS type A sorting domain-containing protein [Saprospiraceae bacterium]